MRISREEMLAPTDIPFDKVPPYRIKMVEYTKPTTREQRKELISKYLWSAPNLPAEYIFVNMCTDSGTAAMSDRQWGAMMLGDESYFFSESWFTLEKVLQEYTGMEFVLPCHQGRSGEAIVYENFIREGDIIPSNCHFTTTRAHTYFQNATPVDITTPEYYDPDDTSWFQGNIDLEALEKLFIDDADKIGFVEMVVPNNLCAGQSVSMANIRAVRALIDKYATRECILSLDVARIPENAWVIKNHEAGYGHKTSLEIVQEMMSYADVSHMSSKKGALVNMGGFVSARKKEHFQRMQPKLIRNDGFITYGGLSGRDMEALAVGLMEGVNDHYLQGKQRQTDVFADACESRGVAIFRPACTLGIWILAEHCLPHIPKHQGPGTALASQAYIEGGVALTSMDSLHRGREDPDDPTNVEKIELAPYELIRCAVPRRAYTDAQLEWVAESLYRSMEWGEKVPGYQRLDLSRPRPDIEERNLSAFFEQPELDPRDIGLRAFFDQYEPLHEHP